MVTLVNTDIPCALMPVIDPPGCDCWDEVLGQQSSPPPDCPGMWLQPHHWAPGMFAGAPSNVNSARVCARTGKIVHVMSGNHMVDLRILSDHPEDKSRTPLYMQYGYCTSCRVIEWCRYCTQMPSSPIIWFICRRH
jgi:hypothetical protein